MTTLGIDLGTSAVKVAAVDSDGRLVAGASRPYDMQSPLPGWAEADPQHWLTATRAATAEVLSAATTIDSVGFCGQMHGVVVTDSTLRPLRPAILWPDTRSAREARELAAALAPGSLTRLGSPAVVGVAATILAWLAHNEPDVMDRAAHVLQPKDWLRAALGGAVVTDPSDASGTLMYDVVDGRRSQSVLDLVGLDPALLPDVVGSTRFGGTLTGLAPLLDGASCVVGGADTACALIGLGVRTAPGAFVAVGTGAQVVAALPDPALDDTLRTHTFCGAGEPGTSWYRLGAVRNSGLVLGRVLSWLGARAPDADSALSGGVREDDPIFVPYLSGERTPFMDPDLRGSWHGLSLTTDREAMLRSALEGIAHAVALAVAAVRDSGATLPEVVPLVGGGTHSAAFRQLLAEATGLCLVTTDAPDASVIGAALLAAGDDVRPAPVAGGERVFPDPFRTELLRERRDKMVEYAMRGHRIVGEEST